MAKLSSQWLLDNIQDGQRLALSWGTALQAMVWAVTASRQYDLEVVQLVGGLSSVDAGVTGQELVRELATRLGARYRYLHAPALVANHAAVEAFLSERSVSSALDAAKSADIAFVGVGTYGDSSSAAIIEAMTLSAADRAQLESMAPAGDICARYYDINGVPVALDVVHDRVIAVDLDDLRRVPMVVGVTCGRVKAPGLVGALRGGHLDVLICDESAARAALALDSATPRPGSEGTHEHVGIHLGFRRTMGRPDAAELAAGQAIHGRHRGVAWQRRGVHRPRQAPPACVPTPPWRCVTAWSPDHES